MWNWFMWFLFGPARMPLNKKLRQVIQMDRGRSDAELHTEAD